MAKDTPGKLKPVMTPETGAVEHWVYFLDKVRDLYPTKALGILQIAQYVNAINNLYGYGYLQQFIYAPIETPLPTNPEIDMLERALEKWALELNVKPCIPFLWASINLARIIASSGESVWTHDHSLHELLRYESTELTALEEELPLLVLPPLDFSDPEGWVNHAAYLARKYANDAIKAVTIDRRPPERWVFCKDRRNVEHYAWLCIRVVGRETFFGMNAILEERKLKLEDSDEIKDDTFRKAIARLSEEMLLEPLDTEFGQAVSVDS